jgi:hypothetical protein
MKTMFVRALILMGIVLFVFSSTSAQVQLKQTTVETGGKSTLLQFLTDTQTRLAPIDTPIVFASPRVETKLIVDSTAYKNAWGIDLFISDNGFGGGAFYRREFSDALFGFISLGISEGKGDSEFEYYDYYGNTYVRGKVNRVMMVPLLVGVQYRLFKDDIVDNFRPYVNGGVGPVMLYQAPFDREFFNSLGYGKAHYTIGGYLGFGANFGWDKSNLFGVNFRYYFSPFPPGIEVMQDTFKKSFGGLFITLNFGFVY